MALGVEFEDIRKHLFRTVSDPSERFSENRAKWVKTETGQYILHPDYTPRTVTDTMLLSLQYLTDRTSAGVLEALEHPAQLTTLEKRLLGKIDLKPIGCSGESEYKVRMTPAKVENNPIVWEETRCANPRTWLAASAISPSMADIVPLIVLVERSYDSNLRSAIHRAQVASVYNEINIADFVNRLASTSSTWGGFANDSNWQPVAIGVVQLLGLPAYKHENYKHLLWRLFHFFFSGKDLKVTCPRSAPAVALQAASSEPVQEEAAIETKEGGQEQGKYVGSPGTELEFAL